MTFTLVGLGQEAVNYLENGEDVCFGKLFAKTAPECIECRAPAVVDGKVVLLKELCAMKCLGVAGSPKLNRLSSKAVMERLERKQSLASIFREILGDVPPTIGAANAREVLVTRLLYLKTIGIDPGPVPRVKDLMEQL